MLAPEEEKVIKLHRKNVETYWNKAKQRMKFIFMLGDEEIYIEIQHDIKTRTSKIIPEGKEKF